MPGSGGKVKRRRPFSPLERQTRPRTDDAGANDASFGGFGGASDVRDPGTHGVTGGAVRLNFEQAEALRYVRGGRSILLTGSAGTGKTRTLNEIIRSLPRATTFVTATTGLAASHVGGMTVHAFAGVGVSDSTSVAGFVAAARRPAAAARWRSCTHLVVDEISMLSADHFDWLEAAARVARGSDAPFGGIQLVLSGDFYQLPPVEKYDKHRKVRAMQFFVAVATQEAPHTSRGVSCLPALVPRPVLPPRLTRACRAARWPRARILAHGSRAAAAAFATLRVRGGEVGRVPPRPNGAAPGLPPGGRGIQRHARPRARGTRRERAAAGAAGKIGSGECARECARSVTPARARARAPSGLGAMPRAHLLERARADRRRTRRTWMRTTEFFPRRCSPIARMSLRSTRASSRSCEARRTRTSRATSAHSAARHAQRATSCSSNWGRR